jgi:hypothetical protein
MSSSTIETSKVLARGVTVTDDALMVELSDGRTIAVPLAWYPRLAHGTTKEQSSWRLIAGARGIHWPELDEDISVDNHLLGQPSGESQSSFQRWLAKRAGKKGRSRRDK